MHCFEYSQHIFGNKLPKSILMKANAMDLILSFFCFFCLFTSNMLSVNKMQFVSVFYGLNIWIPVCFLHCLHHSVLHHSPMEVIFLEFVHRDLVTHYCFTVI